MTYVEKVLELRQKIEAVVTPLITRDYWLLEVPYYPNVGDSLIWQGELDFLRAIPHRCKGMFSLGTCPRNIKIKPTDIIIFQGGGNFGDLWPRHHNFKLEIVARFPHNKIVFLPQSVCYRDYGKLNDCMRLLRNADNLVVCARDHASYELLQSYLPDAVKLVPDMAFSISPGRFHKCWAGSGELLILREDQELRRDALIDEISHRPNIKICDWPSMNASDFPSWLMMALQSCRYHVGSIADMYARMFYRRYLISSGINLIMPYETVYSTRLHGAILGLLLGKRVVLIDNSYGKNRAVYETWMKDVPNICMED